MVHDNAKISTRVSFIVYFLFGSTLVLLREVKISNSVRKTSIYLSSVNSNSLNGTFVSSVCFTV